FVGLLAHSPSPSHVTHHGQIVVRHASSRRVGEVCAAALDKVSAYADPYELIDEIKAQLATIDLPAISDRQQAKTLDEIILDSDQLAPWVVPGLIRVDWRIVLVAFEGSGKSTLLRQIAACAAQGVHPLRNQRFEPLRVLIVDLKNPAAAIAETGTLLRDRLVREVGNAY